MSEELRHKESALFSRVVQGDHQAFGEVHQLYRERLLYYGQRIMGDWNEVEDVVADGFVALWQSRHQIQSDAHLKNFLFVTVRNKALNRLGKKNRHGKYVEQLTLAPITDQELVDAEMVEAEMMHLVDQAVLSLPPECRKIFELAYDQGHPPAQIAHLLGMKPATVRSQKRRAIQLIQAWLKSHGPFFFVLQNIFRFLLHDRHF